jgi:GntR family transcriptional regulator of arabinose operon
MTSANVNTKTGRESRLALKYVRARNQIHDDISSGRLAPGQPLPPEARLMETLGISRYTIRQALAELENDGFIRRVQGKGTFVTTTEQRQAQKLTDVFGLISPRLQEGFYPSLVHGFEQASAIHEHQVVISNSRNDSDRQGNLILQMIDRAVGGVAIVPTTINATPEYQIRQLKRHHIPVVFCHRTVEGIAAPCVTWSGEEVGRIAGNTLIELGHRRITALFPHPHGMTNAYTDGLRRACTDAGFDSARVQSSLYGSVVIMPPLEVEAAIHASLARIFNEPHRPTAIFCGNLPDAEVVYLVAEKFGLRIPDDLSLIYFGGTWRDHGIAQRISCVAVDEHAVGASAADLLHEMRSGKRPLDDNEKLVFPVSLLTGETVGPARP